MGSIKTGNFREMSIPQLEQIIRQHRWYFDLAQKKRIPANNSFLMMVCEQNKKATAALIIAKKESKVHELRLEISTLEHDYESKWGDES